MRLNVSFSNNLFPFFSYIHNHIHTVHSFISIRRGLSPFSSLLLRSERKTSLGCRAGIWTRACRTAGQRIIDWATLHPTEPRCTLLSHAALHPAEPPFTLLSHAAPFSNNYVNFFGIFFSKRIKDIVAGFISPPPFPKCMKINWA